MNDPPPRAPPNQTTITTPCCCDDLEYPVQIKRKIIIFHNIYIRTRSPALVKGGGTIFSLGGGSENKKEGRRYQQEKVCRFWPSSFLVKKRIQHHSMVHTGRTDRTSSIYRHRGDLYKNISLEFFV